MSIRFPRRSGRSVLPVPCVTSERSAGLLLAAAAGLATVALLLACFPPVGIGAVAWIALAPLLAVLPRLPVRAVEWTGFLTGLAFYAASFPWFWVLFGFPSVALWGILALFFAAFCALVRTLPRGLPLWQRSLLTGCFWVALEYIRAEQWPLRFSWLSLGYSQHDQFAILPAASWIGVYGLSFLLAAASAALAGRQLRVVLGVVAGLAVLHLAQQVRPPAPTAVAPGKMGARVVLVQSESLIREDLYRLAEAETRGVSLPTLVVWPEYVEQFTETESPEAYAEIRDWADRENVMLVFGGLSGQGGDAYSSAAFVVGPDGSDRGVAMKHNPLPFFRDGLPDTSYPVFAWKAGDVELRFGAAICFDLSFERNARMLARNGAGFLVVPSHEPPDWPRLEQAQHALIAPLRAVENDIGILRASTPGPSQIVDHRGVVIASLAAGREGALAGAPPTGGTGRTLYNRIGWPLPWVCQLVTVWWIARLWLTRHAARGHTDNRDS